MRGNRERGSHKWAVFVSVCCIVLEDVFRMAFIWVEAGLLESGVLDPLGPLRIVWATNDILPCLWIWCCFFKFSMVSWISRRLFGWWQSSGHDMKLGELLVFPLSWSDHVLITLDCLVSLSTTAKVDLLDWSTITNDWWIWMSPPLLVAHEGVAGDWMREMTFRRLLVLNMKQTQLMFFL